VMGGLEDGDWGIDELYGEMVVDISFGFRT